MKTQTIRNALRDIRYGMSKEEVCFRNGITAEEYDMQFRPTCNHNPENPASRFSRMKKDILEGMTQDDFCDKYIVTCSFYQKRRVAWEGAIALWKRMKKDILDGIEQEEFCKKYGATCNFYKSRRAAWLTN